MELVVISEFEEVARGEEHELRVMIEVEAGPAPRAEERAPMTLVLALDVSSSMRGAPLLHLKEAVARLVAFLAPGDRVGVVTFSAEAEVLVPVVEADEEGCALVLDTVSGLATGRLTNFEAALACAGAMMPERRHHEQQVVLLLSDGYPSVGLDDEESLREVVEGWAEGVSLTTSGLGSHHRSDLMQALSRAGRGGYHYIADPMLAEHELASALGQRHALVAARAEIVLAPRPGVRLVRAQGGLEQYVGSDGIHVELGTLLADTSRVVVATLEVEPDRELGVMELLGVELCHEPAGASETRTRSGEARVLVASQTGPASRRVAVEGLLVEVDAARQEARAAFGRGRGERAADALVEALALLSRDPELSEEALVAEARMALEEELALMTSGDRERHEALVRYSPGSVREDVVGEHSHSLVVEKGAADFDVFCLEGPDAGRRWRVAGEAVVGRSHGAEVRLQDEMVTRRHAELVLYDGRGLIRDLGSTNGTHVNGRSVEVHPIPDEGLEVLVGDSLLWIRRSS